MLTKVNILKIKLIMKTKKSGTLILPNKKPKENETENKLVFDLSDANDRNRLISLIQSDIFIEGYQTSASSADTSLKITYTPIKPISGKIKQVVDTMKVTVVKVEILSIKFNSDHGVLKDNVTDFGDGGSLYPEPEWQPSRSTHPNAPITQTKNTNLNITMTIDLEPNGLTLSYKLIGDSDYDYLDFSFIGDIKSGSNIITMTANEKLPNYITKDAGNTISWILKIKSSSCKFEMNTGPHKIYVTAGKPYGSDITEKRIEWITSLCDKKTKAHECAAKIHDSTAAYALGSPMPDPIWLIADGTPAECHHLSYFYKACIEMLGWPSGSVVYLYPTLGHGSKESKSGFDNEVRAIDGAKMFFIDYSGGPNNFEGAFKYTVKGITKYYAGGAGIYSTPKECMVDICDETRWALPSGGSELAEDWP